jgi:SNF2 family DNA or RNA helicase
VFSQWTSLLDRIEPLLTQEGIAFTRLDGSTRDRAGVVSGFQDPNGPPVMLISLKAGGTGLTLTRADHVFIVDPWWNPAVEDQAGARAHRIGQERPVLHYRLVAKDTVEEQIVRLQDQKRQLAESLLDQNPAAMLTKDDLRSLLS